MEKPRFFKVNNESLRPGTQIAEDRFYFDHLKVNPLTPPAELPQVRFPKQ